MLRKRDRRNSRPQFGNESDRMEKFLESLGSCFGPKRVFCYRSGTDIGIEHAKRIYKELNNKTISILKGSILEIL